MIINNSKLSKLRLVSLYLLLMLASSTSITDEILQTDTDADGLPDAWETKYGLNPQNSADAESDQDKDGVPALEEFINGTIPGGSLDIDGDGQYDALTDGLLLSRALFGLTNSALLDGVLPANAPFNSSEQIQARIDKLGDLVDIDNNGQADALSDGLIILRYLFGIKTATLINNAVAANGVRTEPDDILLHLEGLMPADTDRDGVYNQFDAFPDDPAEIADSDADGIGNNADTDDDNDGIADGLDQEQAVPLTLDKLQADTFSYFWETTDNLTGLAPDRYPASWAPSSIAAIGFALTAYPVAVERQFISRQQAVERTLTTLEYLWQLPLGAGNQGTAGYQGFYYHFLDMQDGLRFQGWDVELSTVDTALLMAGVLFAQSYFSADNPEELQIRNLADQLYKRVNWQWAQNNNPLISLGWFPDQGFINYDWVGYNEAMLVYILALGSPTYPVEPEAWQAWTNHYQDDWGYSGGIEHLTMAPMFGHQYSHIWIDFRNIQDDYMDGKDSDYFINSTKATYAQRQYAMSNPQQWEAYSNNLWGLTACDGPGNFTLPFKGSNRNFRAYSARGIALNHSFDDGTLSPTAVGGSLPFAPEIALPALQTMYAQYAEHLYGEYGFLDAFNPSFDFDMQPAAGKIVPGVGWFGTHYIGIDQGPILLMAENFRSELVWDVMKNNPYIRRGLERAGFTGGWLEQSSGAE
ncbi:MAG: hypothetical protein NZ697_02215 [Porticoccaceae bacterium]|nr:hypothetical protein [Porticoccaceae bacterium]